LQQPLLCGKWEVTPLHQIQFDLVVPFSQRDLSVFSPAFFDRVKPESDTLLLPYLSPPQPLICLNNSAGVCASQRGFSIPHNFLKFLKAGRELPFFRSFLHRMPGRGITEIE
jgi:hypothetical protein